MYEYTVSFLYADNQLGFQDIVAESAAEARSIFQNRRSGVPVVNVLDPRVTDKPKTSFIQECGTNVVQETVTMNKFIVTDAAGVQMASFVMRPLDIEALDEMDEGAANLIMDAHDAEMQGAFEAACNGQELDPMLCSYYQV